MTIAAGFVCIDGIVIAADSEHSVVRSERGPIFGVSKREYEVILTGTGTSHLIRMAFDELCDVVDEKDNIRTIRTKIKEVVSNICQQHIFSLYQANDSRRPSFDLLIAVKMRTREGDKQLFKTTDAALSTVDHCDFVGTGSSLAISLASWLYDQKLTTDVTKVVARQILHWVRKHTPSCGQTTLAVTLRDSGTSPSRSLHEDSQFFWGLHELLKPILIGCLDGLTSDQEFANHLQQFEDKMRAIRREVLGQSILKDE